MRSLWATAGGTGENSTALSGGSTGEDAMNAVAMGDSLQALGENSTALSGGKTGAMQKMR